MGGFDLIRVFLRLNTNYRRKYITISERFKLPKCNCASIMHDYCYDVNEYLWMRQFKSIELTYMGAANDKSILYKCAFSQECSLRAACHAFEENILCV